MYVQKEIYVVKSWVISTYDLQKKRSLKIQYIQKIILNVKWLQMRQIYMDSCNI